MSPVKKLFRSIKDKQVAGMIGGLAEYLGMDSSILRLIWIAVTVFTGILPGILIYITAALIVPIDRER